MSTKSKSGLKTRSRKRCRVLLGVLLASFGFSEAQAQVKLNTPRRAPAKINKPIGHNHRPNHWGSHWTSHRHHHHFHSHGFYHRPRYHNHLYFGSVSPYRYYDVTWGTWGTHLSFYPSVTSVFYQQWVGPQWYGVNHHYWAMPYGYSWYGNLPYSSFAATPYGQVSNRVNALTYNAPDLSLRNGRSPELRPKSGEEKNASGVASAVPQIEEIEEVVAEQIASPEPVPAYAMREPFESNVVALAGWKAPKVVDLTSGTTTRPRTIRVERAKPAVRMLTPTSDVWADSAIGSIDDLLQRGEIDAALEACEAMATNPKLPAEVILRHGILKLFAPGAAVENDEVLDLLNAAAAAGCEMRPAELGCESIRVYLAPLEVSFDETLEQFSKAALKQPDGSIDLLLLISTLLKLDGQDDRARFFAKEAFDRAAVSGELKWSSLSLTLSRN